jgi:hypothetical protein
MHGVKVMRRAMRRPDNNDDFVYAQGSRHGYAAPSHRCDKTVQYKRFTCVTAR